ncbi:CRIB domain-containing protein RIC4 isoform X2 [Beta vulgaris subsp. vulgaris]|uniref:CRIB domain-containing protein RIC4 isoform X2 n=1 Tax=Beta vulgaris subsp. vulgaris TaxID=3555 RepID=UPI00053FF91D|nr:CRIB domain-containing protein RIC4 isoform X2 [Beta vulgaris subsp. vulgaris]
MFGQGKMRGRMEKYVVLPFSMGCVSQASVAVAEQRPRRTKADLLSPSLRIREEDDDDDSLSGESMKHSSRFLALPRPNLSTGVNRLVKGFKSLSQLFIYEDEMEGLGMNMEIGSPTDVKHVTHIGWDSLANNDPLMGWDNLISTELLAHPTSSADSLKQFNKLAATAVENDSPTFVSKLNASTSLA